MIHWHTGLIIPDLRCQHDCTEHNPLPVTRMHVNVSICQQPLYIYLEHSMQTQYKKTVCLGYRTHTSVIMAHSDVSCKRQHYSSRSNESGMFTPALHWRVSLQICTRPYAQGDTCHSRLALYLSDNQQSRKQGYKLNCCIVPMDRTVSGWIASSKISNTRGCSELHRKIIKNELQRNWTFQAAQDEFPVSGGVACSI